MRFLLVLALAWTGAVQGTTEHGDELGTPNINTIIEWVRSEYPNLPRIQTTNCRKIANSDEWSQHSWANAADIFPTSKAQGDEIKARLRSKFGEWIATLLWQVPMHFDHIHVDTWPEGIYTPPCAGGTITVAYENGDIGHVFTDDIPEGGDDMPLTQEDIDKIVAAVTPAVAQAVWFNKIHDAVTGVERGAAFHLRMAREDALKAATRALGSGPSAAEIADAVIDEIAS